MYVPNYVPSQVEIPGSVAEKSWREKLLFLRYTTLWFGILALLIITVAFVVPYDLDSFRTVVILAAGGCLFLNLVRTFARDSQLERGPSLVIAPFVVLTLGMAVGGCQRLGFPVWSLASSWLFFTLYTYLCGRDFSFLGQLFLGWFSSLSLDLLVVWVFHLGWKTGAQACLLTLAGSFYFSYDLASIMSRRRRGEELHAGIDFLRDMFNFVGFGIRCRRHWRRHKIWVVPKVS